MVVEKENLMLLKNSCGIFKKHACMAEVVFSFFIDFVFIETQIAKREILYFPNKTHEKNISKKKKDSTSDKHNIL